MVDSWSMGQFEDPGRRLIRGLAWLRADTDGDNGYARPIGGLVAVVDLNTMEVVRVDDHGPLPVPDGDGDYRNGGGHGFRDDVRPIEITQPEGPSFTLDGRHLHWQRWDMRVGWSAREGLVLHQIGYTERRRAAAGRATARRSPSWSIPYGDPNPTVHFKNAFDIGEYGIGPYVNSLELGCDCLGEIRYLDAWVSDSRGRPAVIRNAICIHEEDVGILWKHHDDRSGRTDVARARRLVVSCIATVGNYEYGFFWYFGQDGSIEFEGKLTGIVHTAGIEPGSAQSPRDRGDARGGGVLPPALLLRPAGHGRRRHREHGRRGRCPARPAGAGEPGRHGLPRRPHRARARGDGGTGRRPDRGPAAGGSRAAGGETAWVA